MLLRAAVRRRRAPPRPASLDCPRRGVAAGDPQPAAVVANAECSCLMHTSIVTRARAPRVGTPARYFDEMSAARGPLYRIGGGGCARAAADFVSQCAGAGAARERLGNRRAEAVSGHLLGR